MTKPPKHKSKPFVLPKALTPNQAKLMGSIQEHDMTIVIGPAGTGKSFCSAAYAAYYYYTGKVDKIILVRPTIPVGKGIGFLPGELLEKMLPWAMPIIKVLERHLSANEVECMIKNGKLEILAFDHIRGHTFEDAFIILDEAQNCTITDVKAFVTRIGNNSRTVIDGDIEQSDLKNYEESGLEYLVNRLTDDNNCELSDKVGFVEFEDSDCVRSELCRLWLKAFRNE